MNDSLFPGYASTLEALKQKIQAAQLKAALSVNAQLIGLYWEMGQTILQQLQGWGAKVIDRLSKDLHSAFPEMKGFSPRNLKYMRAFAEAYPSEAIVQVPLAQITWYHHITLLEKVKEPAQRLWYAQQVFQHGWSRNIMALQIEGQLFHRQGKALTNFERTLPPFQSDLARQTLKDPYLFDFLSLGKEAHEREVEDALLSHITARAAPQVSAGVGCRLRLRWSAISPGSRWAGLFPGLTLLPSQATLLCGD